jgi:hypothetical protein
VKIEKMICGTQQNAMSNQECINSNSKVLAVYSSFEKRL